MTYALHITFGSDPFWRKGTGPGQVGWWMENPMGLGKKRLGEILVDYGLLNEDQLEDALQKHHEDQPLGKTCVELGYTSEELLLKVLSIQLGLPSVRVQDVEVPSHVLRKVPVALAEEFQCLPLAIISDSGTDTLLLAMARPLDTEALDAIRFVSQLRVLPLIASDGEMESALRRLYWGDEGESADALDPELELSLPHQLRPDDSAGFMEADTPLPDALAITPEELLEELTRGE